MTGIKPCPVCGGEADIIAISYDRRHFVVCEKCGFKQNEFYTAEEAVEDWNGTAERGAE